MERDSGGWLVDESWAYEEPKQGEKGREQGAEGRGKICGDARCTRSLAGIGMPAHLDKGLFADNYKSFASRYDRTRTGAKLSCVTCLLDPAHRRVRIRFIAQESHSSKRRKDV